MEGKKEKKKTTISNFKLYIHMSVKELGTITAHITKHTSYTARNKQEKFESSFMIHWHAESMKKKCGSKLGCLSAKQYSQSRPCENSPYWTPSDLQLPLRQ